MKIFASIQFPSQRPRSLDASIMGGTKKPPHQFNNGSSDLLSVALDWSSISVLYFYGIRSIYTPYSIVDVSGLWRNPICGPSQLDLLNWKIAFTKRGLTANDDYKVFNLDS